MESARQEGNLSTRVQYKHYTKLQSPAGLLSFPLRLPAAKNTNASPVTSTCPHWGSKEADAGVVSHGAREEDVQRRLPLRPGPVQSVLSQRSLQSAKLWKKKNGCHPMLSLQAAELWKKMAEHSAPAQPQQISSSTILPSGCAAFF